jgi:hypothetical protein
MGQQRTEEQKARYREADKFAQRRMRARIRARAADGLIDVPENKKCGSCQTIKPAAEFSNSVNSRDGLYNYCRSCDAVSQRARVERDRAEDLAGWQERRADVVRKHRHGITGDEFALLAEAQEFCCAICGQAKALCVDHDHGTGEIRGLLCKKCNSGIGLLGDDPVRVAIALTYLLKGG